MKAVFIVYNQAVTEQIEQAMHDVFAKGFTRWTEVQGAGEKGEPHLGSHAWPSKNMATLTIVDDDKAVKLKEKIHAIDEAAPQQGLRVFVWNVEND